MVDPTDYRAVVEATNTILKTTQLRVRALPVDFLAEAPPRFGPIPGIPPGWEEAVYPVRLVHSPSGLIRPATVVVVYPAVLPHLGFIREMCLIIPTGEIPHMGLTIAFAPVAMYSKSHVAWLDETIKKALPLIPELNKAEAGGTGPEWAGR